MTRMDWERAKQRDAVRGQPPVKGNRSRKLPKATQKQLRYLKLLAQRTGSTFITPKSRREASSEIDRLRSKKRKK